MPTTLDKVKILILLCLAVKSFLEVLTFPVNTPADLGRAKGQKQCVTHLLPVTRCARTVGKRDMHGDSQEKAVPAVWSSLFSG